VDARTIESVYRTHGHSVIRRARALLGNEDEARELLHEVFVSLLDRPEQFGDRSGIVTWLYAVTTHGCLNRLRNARKRRQLLEDRAAVSVASSTDSPELHAILRQLLARLPSELAEVAAYHYLDGMTHDEIATILGCSRRHVGDLVSRMHARVEQEAS
jgi:RNA polymerase sigma factor (sigma-70 family)